MSVNVNIPGGNNATPSLSFQTYIPAPPVLPAPAIPRPQVICSDTYTRTLTARYKKLLRAERVRFVYTPQQADTVAARRLSLSNGLKDSRTVTVSFGLQIGIGQKVVLDDDSGSRYIGRVYGVELNSTGKLVTKSLMLRRIYE